MTTTTPSRKRTPKSTQPVLLRRRSDGQVEALSSDGTTIYTVRIGETVQCQCLGFTHYGRCKHVAAAIARYAAFWASPSYSVRRPVCDECGSPLDAAGSCPCDGPAPTDHGHSPSLRARGPWAVA